MRGRSSPLLPMATYAAIAACVGGCGGKAAPHDQWKVVLSTDAPVPQLGQQLLVEILDDAGHVQSPDARRLIDASRAGAWPISFGIVPDRPQARPRIHVRLYRLEATGDSGLPTGAALIDATAALPIARGLTEVGLTLAMNCFSVLPDLGAHTTCDPASGQLAPEPTLAPGVDTMSLPAPGSWPPARSVPCGSAAPSGMVCVPGGIFLVGSVHFFPLDLTLEPVPQRLVQLHPFAIDLAEFTVGEVRSLVRTQGLLPPVTQTSTPGCTYVSGSDASNDTMPATCVPWSTADQACSLLGKRLPTEAEWEYVARNLDLETPYPWGSDATICEHSIVARDRGDAIECLTSAGGTLAPGPVPGGSPLDTTALGVSNLGGNVSEWVADSFDVYSGPCWTGAVLLVDPRCERRSTLEYSIRGGSWQKSAASATSASRNSGDKSLAAGDVGFRCAMSR